MLTNEEIAFYDENGYLTIRSLFSDEEMDLLSNEFNELQHKADPNTIVKEKNGDIRSIFAPHSVSAHFDRVTKLTRIVKPVEQLLREKTYLYQHKVNIKRAFTGDWWEWHQDFAFWHHEDEVPNPDMVSVMVFLSDMDYESGPLMVIPRSHKDIADFDGKEVKDALNDTVSDDLKAFASSFTADLKYTVDRAELRAKVKQNRIHTVTGKKGDVLFFHCNVIHASNINMSPEDRVGLIISYNNVKNFTKPSNRPGYIANPDNSAISAESLVELLVEEQAEMTSEA